MLMKPHTAPTTTPRVWVLQTARAGDSAQARALSQALGWRADLKTLQFNSLYNVPNKLLGASLVSLTAETRKTLQPPWPDLVIGVARRTVPAARWIRQQSGGHSKLVQIGRPRLDPTHFDLVITSPQYGVRPSSNVLNLPVPVHPPLSVSNEDLQHWSDQFQALPRPWTGIILGGSPWPFRFDAAAVNELAQKINSHTNGNGACLICSSPRTPSGAVADLASRLGSESFAAEWSAQGPNPYREILELSDQLVVCGDSASMLGEACSTGKPVFIFNLPNRPLASATAQIGRALSKSSLINPPRNMAAVHAGLIENGHAERLGAIGAFSPVRLPNQLAIASDRVAALFADR